MASHGLWRRRAWLGVVACALLVIGVAAGSAAANDMSPVASYEFDGDVHYFNQGAMDQTKILSYNGYQYVIYWDAKNAEGNVVLAVTRRRLSDNARETVRFNTREGYLQREGDYHNTNVVGISKVDETLHVAWANHNQPMNYAVSNRGCLSKTRFSECTFTWRLPTGDVTEGAVVYPMFFNDVTGNLYLSWRYRNSENGAVLIDKYNNNGTWTFQGAIIDGQTGSYDPDGTWTDTDRDGVRDPGEPGFMGEARTRGVYVDNIMFDPNDRMQVTWSFREAEGAGHPERGTGTSAWGANIHDIYYSYSDDLGRTWFNNAGRQIGTIRTDPITIADHSDALVVSIPGGYWRTNFGRMTLDWEWQPHLVFEHSETQVWSEYETSYRYEHFWRSKDGSWHSNWVTASAADRWPGNGSLMFDRDNDAFYIGVDNRFDWVAFNRPEVEYNADLPAGNVTWQEGTYMHVVPATAITGVQSYAQVETPIGTRSTENSVIEASIRNDTNNSTLRFNFITTAQREWGQWEGERRAETTVANDGRFHTVRMTMSMTGWRGTLRSLEIEIPGTTGSIDVDYIHIQNGSGTVAKRWEFDTGTKLIGAEAASTDGYETWEVHDLLPDERIGNVSITNDDSAFSIDYNRYELEGVVDFTAVEQGRPGIERMHVESLDILGDEPYVKMWEWGVPGDESGWVELRDVSGLTQANDGGTRVLSGTITGTDSQIYSGAGNLHSKLGGADTIKIRMKNERATGQEARVCWTVNGGTTFRTEQCSTFRVTADNTYRIYEIEPVGLAGWRAENELSQLRFEPSEGGTIRSGAFKLDYIRILDNRP